MFFMFLYILISFDQLSRLKTNPKFVSVFASCTSYFIIFFLFYLVDNTLIARAHYVFRNNVHLCCANLIIENLQIENLCFLVLFINSDLIFWPESIIFFNFIIDSTFTCSDSDQISIFIYYGNTSYHLTANHFYQWSVL